MTRDIVTLSEEDNLEGIAAAMERYQFRHVPVVDAGRLVGMVSQRDVLRLAMSSLLDKGGAEVEARLEEQTFVARVMTRDPVHVLADTTLGEAAELMVVHKVGALPVLDANQKLVGIVTTEDVLRAAMSYFPSSRAT